MKSKAGIAVIAAALILGACTNGTGGADPTATTGAAGEAGTTRTTDGSRSGGGGLGAGAGVASLPFTFALQQFDECDALLTWIRSEAAERVGPYGFGDNFNYFPRGRTLSTEFDDAGGDEVAAAFEGAAEAPAADFSTTNVQEVGVDEPDLVKTDGRFLYVLADNALYTIAVDRPDEIHDSIRFDELFPHELLIGPDRLYLLANVYGPTPLAEVSGDAIAPEYSLPTLVIIEVRVDSGRLQEQGRLEVSGSYVTARQVGDGARVIVRHSPQDTLPFVYPGSEQAEDRAAEVNRQVVLDSTLEQWLPSFRLDDGSEVTTGLLPACDRVRTTQEFSGLATLSVLTLDMSDSLSNGNALSLFGAGDTVYASPTSLYAATFAYPNVIFLEDGTVEQDDDFTTAIHQFDITAASGAEYVASGVVPGHLLNQFAMSEHEGYLRVAVTEGSPWFCCSDEAPVSSVRVLSPRDGELVEVGAVGDLGPDESIFGVRFLGDTGYVVTFRQTDPLYVIDLSEPTAPTVRGELKITGYSAYLHPIGDGLVIGVGQEATTDGATIGTKVSLFDVSDPTNPREIDRWVEERSSSIVEYEHKAFLYWAPESIAVIPIDSWGANRAGAVVLEVRDRALLERGRISQSPVEDAKPPAGCEDLDLNVFEGTEWDWIRFEAALAVTCDDEPRPLRFGTFYCEPLEQFGIPEGDLPDEIDDEARVSICWPEHYDRGEIRRSVVTGDVLWTVGHRTVQANDLQTYEMLGRVTL